MPANPKSVIGVDLGTTNCALAAATTSIENPLQLPPVEQFSIPQLVNPGEIREQPLFPSCLFLYGPADFAPSAVALPWDPSPRYVAGQLAKSRGAEVPDRVVLSAKSWLCHSGVDRESALLPPTAPDGVHRISPVEASRLYLEHLRQAWNDKHPELPLEDQRLIVTVPASFDAVARDLTLRAAEEAGYRDVVLLEEPQAAFYAWIERHPYWRDRAGVGDLILVIDIGGGTTDFSLISVGESGGNLHLERVAVGEHILLGGDNMDLALAHFMQEDLAAKGKRIDPYQFNALWQNCRNGKEKLLAEDDEAAEYPVTLLGKGRSLVGSSIKAALRRDDLESIVLDGFFPKTASAELPERTRQASLQEVGLPYAQDAAVTRHLARFLRQPDSAAANAQLRRTASGLAAPTHILFNGGVFRASKIRSRLLETLNAWLAAENLPPVIPLEGEDLMHAVSRGAAYYGLARQGAGVRIRGGISRSYYVGVQASMPAIPGRKPPLRALTVAQFGMEEGTRIQSSQREFALLVGEPADFRFFSSNSRKDDPPGTLVDDAIGELEELAPMEVTLPAAGDRKGVVPVTLETEITPTGQLQLWCVARDGHRWKLEFNVRERLKH